MSTRSLKSLLVPFTWCLVLSAWAQSLQVVSTRDPSQGPPPGGSGDSWGSILSADGRYVLFASTASNLMLTTNGTPIRALFPASLNVYVRDRSAKTTTLVSLNVAGTGGGNADSLPMAISTNGQYVLFESSATDLVANDTNEANDVFLWDRASGATRLVSVNTNGMPANDVSRNSRMSPDGRYVAFVSAATDLVVGDTNGIPDVFVRDMQTGSTVLASVGAASPNPSLQAGSSESPEITPDGRFVAFYSTATNLVSGAQPGVGTNPIPGAPLAGDIYVRDLVNGVTIWASSGARDAVFNAWHAATGASYNLAISDDGQFVIYEASPPKGSAGLILRYDVETGQTDLVHTNAAPPAGAYEDFYSLAVTADGQTVVFIANTNGVDTTCVQLWNATNGVSTLLSGDSTGQVPTNSTCDWPSIDPGGRFIAFQSSAPNLTTNQLTGDYHLYRLDLTTGLIVLVDGDTNGVGVSVNPITFPNMSLDGTLVAFDSADGDLIANDRNKAFDAFVRDLSVGTTELMSAHDAALPTITANGLSLLAPTSVSADGRYIAFASEADNLAPNDTNLCRDVFVRDMQTGKTVLVSVATNGFSGDLISTDPAISPDGRYVAFTSSADNLVPGDANRAQDVFVRDLVTGTTTLASYNSTGTGPGAQDSFSPMVSSGGRYVLFHSLAGNLAPGSFTGENLFERDMQLATNYALSTLGISSSVAPAMTPDGRFVVFVSSLSANLCIWDSLATSVIYTNPASLSGSFTSVAISADGSRVAFCFGTTTQTPPIYYLEALDVGTGTNWVIDASASQGWKAPHLSHEGEKLACVKIPDTIDTTAQVYLYDLTAGTKVVASRSFSSSDPGNGASDSPDISHDGRLVAYRSDSSNIVANVNNDVPGIFVYDSLTGVNTLVSANPQTGICGSNWSLIPVFSGDGATLCFESWAPDFVALDFNQSSDVFAFSFLSASVAPAVTPGQGPWISWPYTPGKNYQVQFKDNLSDPAWKEVSGTITNSGNKGYLQDQLPSGSQRFYRVVGF